MDKTNVFHNVVAYTGKEEPAAGMRLSSITFKTQKELAADPTYKKPQNRCVGVPSLKVSCSPEILQEALQEAFEDIQDALIRSLIVAGDSNNKQKLTVSDDEICYDKCAEFAKAQSQSAKLSAETAEAWFVSAVSDKLMVALAAAMKFPDDMTTEQSAKLNRALEQHKKLFGSMVGHKFNPDIKTARSLLKAVNLAEDDKVKRVLAKKLETIINPPTQELLGL